MNTAKKEELKADIRTSLSIIRFLIEEKPLIFGKKNMRAMEDNIYRILEAIEKF